MLPWSHESTFLSEIHVRYYSSPLDDLYPRQAHVGVSCLARFDAIFEHYYEPYFK